MQIACLSVLFSCMFSMSYMENRFHVPFQGAAWKQYRSLSNGSTQAGFSGAVISRSPVSFFHLPVVIPVIPERSAIFIFEVCLLIQKKRALF